MISTPTPTDRHVKDFCRTICAESSPRLVTIRPAPDAEVLDCFANVRRVVARSGGRIVYGWVIWEWSRIYIEAEHHAIYEDTEGQLIDVTPPQFSQITQALFLQDDSALYDFDNEGVRRQNHRCVLSSDPLIEALFETKKAYDDLMDSIPGVGSVSTDYQTFARLERLKAENAAVTKAIAWKFTRRNDPCFCGSGKKFKKCHGRSDQQ